MPFAQEYKTIYKQNNRITEIYNNNKVVWPSVPSSIDYSEPFWVECTSGSVLVKIFSSTSTTYPSGLNFSVQHSSNNTDWVDWGTTGTTALVYGLLVGYGSPRIYIKANTDTWNTNTGAAVRISLTPQGSGTCKIGGNIMSLLYGTNFTSQKEFPANSMYNFFNVFNSSSSLTDTSDLLLPASTLTDGCYAYMFSQCSNLVNSPKLEAKVLTPAGYAGMFRYCGSLSSIECLATNISATNCLAYWVESVPAGGVFTKSTGVTWPTGVNGIPSGWTVQEV